MSSCPVCHCKSVLTYFHPSVQHCQSCAITWMTDRTTRVRYDADYVGQRYDKYPTTEAMSELRLRVMEYVMYLDDGVAKGYRFGVNRGRLLDVGYGNGSFIRRARAETWDAFGHDVNLTAYDGVRLISLDAALQPRNRWRAVTFYDSLEHFENMLPIRQLVDNTDWIVVSVPKPPVRLACGLADWKHWRPGEHHWYFHEPWGLEAVFHSPRSRSRVVYVGYPEDQIRGTLADGRPNIMTVALRTERKE